MRCELPGTSDTMREVRELISRVADTDVAVLIHGEPGTCKELIARTIHGASPRRDRAFVKVNCTVQPPFTVRIGAACCPPDGADSQTLPHVAATGPAAAQRDRRGNSSDVE